MPTALSPCALGLPRIVVSQPRGETVLARDVASIRDSVHRSDRGICGTFSAGAPGWGRSLRVCYLGAGVSGCPRPCVGSCVMNQGLHQSTAWLVTDLVRRLGERERRRLRAAVLLRLGVRVVRIESLHDRVCFLR